MKYLKYFLVGFAFVVLVSFLVRNSIKSNTPPFILNKLEQLKSDKILMDSIGGFSQFEYSYNEQDFKNSDTVKYSIKITGYDQKLIYNGTQVKDSLSSWGLLTDTITIQ